MSIFRLLRRVATDNLADNFPGLGWPLCRPFEAEGLSYASWRVATFFPFRVATQVATLLLGGAK